MLNSLLRINYLNILKLFLILFLLTLLFSHNLIYFFISWVGLNISLYGLLLSGRWSNLGAAEATVKYFTTGIMVTIILLLTMVFFAIDYLTFDFDTLSYLFLKKSVYGLTGSYETIKFSLSLSQRLFYMTICSAFLFKLGAFPFHFYLADIYEVLDLKKNMLVYTVTLKILIFLAMITMVSKFWYVTDVFYPLIVTSAIGSLVIGSFGAMAQVKLRRFWAYSYLNSLGFTLLGLSTGIAFGFGEITFYTCKVYFLSYILAWLGIFLVLSVNSKTYTLKTGSKNNEVYFITDLLKLNINNDFIEKGIVILLLTCLVSLMGLPPTLGFYAKTLIYLGLIGMGKTYVLLLLTLVLAPVMAISYLKLIVYIIYPIVKKSKNKNSIFWNFGPIELLLCKQFFSGTIIKNQILSVLILVILTALLILPILLICGYLVL